MQRVALLAGAFERIGRTRMAGVPILHAGLRTEAVGFQRQTDDDGEGGVLGILLTPWFMNLVWLPDGEAPALAPGASRLRRLGGEALSFIGAEESGCRFEACSLFSPMFEFADQAAARAVAAEALAHLRQAPAPAVTVEPAAMAGPVPGTGPNSTPAAAAVAAPGPTRTPATAPALAAPALPTPAPAALPRPPAGAPGAPTRRGLLFGRRAAEPAR